MVRAPTRTMSVNLFGLKLNKAFIVEIVFVEYLCIQLS